MRANDDKEAILNGRFFHVSEADSFPKIKRLGTLLFRQFLFSLPPQPQPAPFQEMTVNQLVDWIVASVEQRRASGSLPFEYHHLKAVYAALQYAGVSVANPPPSFCQFEKLIASRDFPARWAQMQEYLKTPLPRHGVSSLGCLVSFLVGFGLVGTFYVLAMTWLDAHGAAGRFVVRFGFYAGIVVAILLTGGLCKLLAGIMPGAPTTCSTASTLARYLAQENRAASISAAPWTRERIGRSTQAAIAEAFAIPPSSILPTLPLKSLNR